ncbi:DUF817 family protein [Parasulfitobacter algicola]|uniref:DUF817 domain-containing protein n=1 Tax=Parasulfitobacter algicola TaxID=2614809 RepID=A0ABX2IS38_9RHOB|nr:DUF817 domain-containing protein [Sulfitobacter algicola]
MKQNLSIERRLGDWFRQRLHPYISELILFVLKQAWACLFGGLLLVLIIVTSLIWQDDWPIYRYDFLFACAITLQIGFLVFKLETWREAKVILLFHIVGTIMEIFKIHAGSWAYPEPGYIKLMGVPLFSGFMYAAVGSFMARVIRIFDMRFAPYPPFWTTVLLAIAIYANFFLHHFTIDIRYALFAATLILFWRTRIWFYIGSTPRWMPLPLAAFLTAFFMWIAENIGTMTGTWLYAGQSQLEMVRFAKLGSWYLLLYVSFLLVTLVIREAISRDPWQPKAFKSPKTVAI